ncbi:uncharacterized protein LOC143019761 [Oratosquilla oratoria]|uniref:uncharacterized protein LOC143019761 n=1 Tax=Oratosquilla oratoria TaxID=337810 RepID=UPI003F759EFC
MDKEKHHLRKKQLRSLCSVFIGFSILILAVILVFALVRLRGTRGGGEGRGGPWEEANRPHYRMVDFEDFIRYVTTVKAQCHQGLQFNGTSRMKDEDPQAPGHEGTFLCLDDLPNTPDKCRIYSFDPNRFDVEFELEMGKRRGCRVHIVFPDTEYNYTKLDKNTYYYPLKLSTTTSPGNYTFDNFLNLLDHEHKVIHYVKSTGKGTEWTLLETILSSGVGAIHNIKQIRLLIHLPPIVGDTVFPFFKEKYQLLIGLEYYGFKVMFSRPVPNSTYYHEDMKMTLATKYEVVWLKG